MTPAGIEPVTFRFVAQHLNHCATAVPDMPATTQNIILPLIPYGYKTCCRVTTERSTWDEGVREYGAEEDTWVYEEGRSRRLEKTDY